jgi:hypothetical protein
MRSYAVLTAAILWLVPFVANLAAKAPTCKGDYGTDVLFEDTPQEAAKKALREEKLVFVLHVSGHFEDPKLT